MQTAPSSLKWLDTSFSTLEKSKQDFLSSTSVFLINIEKGCRKTAFRNNNESGYKSEKSNPRFWLEKVLSLATGIPVKQLQFNRTSFGKPFIKGDPLFFNVSYCREHMVIGISNYEIGVDIVSSESINDVRGFFNMIAGNKEKIMLDDYVGGTVVHRMWAAKESIVKLFGTGLRIHPQNVQILPCLLSTEEKIGSKLINVGSVEVGRKKVELTCLPDHKDKVICVSTNNSVPISLWKLSG